MGLIPIVDPQPDKTMLRVYSGASKGATSFFRNRPLLLALMRLCGDYPKHNIKVLFHAGSIGAEAYSFATYCRMTGIDRSHDIQIFATDIDADFLAFARAARYPESILAPMTEQERTYFAALDDGFVGPSEAVRNMVRFLPPLSFVDAVSDEAFDFVFVMNAITYVTEAEQSIALRNIASYNCAYLVTTAFHPDSIESDLTRNGYQPVPTDLEQIHKAWGERIRAGDPPSHGSPEYSWVLPPFSRSPGFEYRFCAIFRKSRARSADIESLGDADGAGAGQSTAASVG